MLNEMFKAASFAHCGNVDFKNKARNTAFDFIKGLAITSVVMGHTRAFSNVMPFFNLWHVGAFFIIVGWFFSAKSWDDIGNAGLFLWKKTKGFGGLLSSGAHSSLFSIITCSRSMFFRPTLTWRGCGFRRIITGFGLYRKW